jgi:hypothetical protein
MHNLAHGYSKVCLSREAAALMPTGLLQAPNSIATWKAIIQQLELEDQLTEGATEPEVVAAQAAGLADFIERVQKTPYATTPLRPRRRSRSEEEDKEVSRGEDGRFDNVILEL